MSYAPIVQRVTPAVVTVSAAKTVENRNPLMDDPFFRRFFGGPQFGGRAQMQRSLGSGVIVDAGRPRRHQQPRHRRRRPGEDHARRQARVRGRGRAEGPAHRSRRAARQGRQASASRCSSSAIPTSLQVGDVVLAVGNPFGVGQTVTHGIVSARRAHPGRHHRLPVLHPDRRRDQSRQFRRRAGRHGRPPGRHQHRDLLALRRLAGHRLRHSGQHGAGGGGLGQDRRRRGQAAVARRQAAGGDAGAVARVRPQAAGRRGGHQRHAGEPGGARRPQDRRRDRLGRRARRSTIPTPSTTASPPIRSAAASSSAWCAAARERKVAIALETAPELPRDEIADPGALAVPRRQGRQSVAGARRRAAARLVDRGRRRGRDRRRHAGAERRLPARRHRARGQQRARSPRPATWSASPRPARALWRVTIQRGGQQISAVFGG